jgi:glyoxylate reductase
MSTIYVTRKIAASVLEHLRANATVKLWTEDRPIPREMLIEEAQGVDGLLVMLTEKVDDALLEALPSVKAVSTMSVGVDHIDLNACKSRGIPVGHTPDVLTEASADHAFALLMAAARRLAEGERYVRAGKWGTWSPDLLLGQDIFGATLGIVGYGRIGQAVERRALGFGMKILLHGGREAADREIPLDDLLRQSDFVSVHVPLTAQTRKLIGAREFALMKPTAILINTARGPIVDPDALVDALKSGQIFGAALDVTDPEPMPADHPLLTLENCLVVPHIASATVQTRTAMADLAARNLLAALAGEPMPSRIV